MLAKKVKWTLHVYELCFTQVTTFLSLCNCFTMGSRMNTSLGYYYNSVYCSLHTKLHILLVILLSYKACFPS